MRRIKPVLAVATLMAAIVGDWCLRRKVHQFDEDYIGVLDLIDGTAARVLGRGRASSLRRSPKSYPRSYRVSAPWSSGSDVPSLEHKKILSSLSDLRCLGRDNLTVGNLRRVREQGAYILLHQIHGPAVGLLRASLVLKDVE